MSSIRLHHKYGLNSSLTLCFLCLEPMGIALLGTSGGKVREALGLSPGDGEAPRQFVADMDPCQKCKDFMRQGIIFISVDPTKTVEEKNPYRSGGWCVLKEEFVKRFLSGEMLDQVLAARVCFISDEAWDRLRLPRGEVTDGVHHKSDSEQ